MPQPTTQHLQLVGGANSANSTIYTSSLLKRGDIVKITGSATTNGVFTVIDVITTLNTADAAGTTFTDATCDTASGDATVTHDANAQIIAGLSVSGTGVRDGSHIASITDSTHFELSKTATANGTNVTLTFGDMDIYYALKGRAIADESSTGSTDPELQVKSVVVTGDKMLALGDVDSQGGVDIWSNAATSTYDSANNGWSASEITPTISGDDAKYIYHIADGAVRVCDINEDNSTVIKWYGYIQKNQFNKESGLVFAEWQEHPNSLNSPRVATSYSYAFGTTSHDGTDAGNYYKSFTDATMDTSNADATVEHDGASTIVTGMSVTGTGIPAGTTVASVTDDDTFELSSNATADGTNVTLTFFANRGVAVIKKAGSEQLQMGLNITAASTGLKFENQSSADKSGRAIVGEVISIKNGTSNGDLGEYPNEFLFCKQGYSSATGNSTYSRAYGGVLTGTAPFDFADNETPIIERGAGWNVGVSAGSGKGKWDEGTYEFYETFIYDGSQESLPVRIGDGASAIATFTHAVSSGETLKVSIYADLAYNGRISGGRIYTRLENSDDDLILLADIDIVKGVRTNLDGDHRAWSYQDGKGYHVVSGAYGNSIEPNLDTYTTINGFSPDLKFLGIGGANEIYKASVVSNRRTFVANVKLKASSGELEKFGDRIMFSEIGKFDTFLEHNFIDVSKGDFGEYVALESYADRILAFKHNLLHIINISSPSVSNWYLEETTRHLGVNHQFSVTKTKNGIAWVSDDGCYLYDGNSVRNLTDRKIAVSKASFTDSDINWNSWYRGSALKKDIMLGYDPISNSLIMMRSPNDSSTNSNKAFVYDFDSNGWTYNTGIFTDSSYYTNFITDFNNNLSLGVFDGSTAIEFKKFLPISLSQSDQEFYTKDIDFGFPSSIKKVYKVVVTYKSDGAETTPFKYAIDGKQSFSSDGGGTFTGNFADTSDKWDVLTLTPSSPVSCQSMQIKFDAPSAGIFEINDMSIQYRVINNKEAT